MVGGSSECGMVDLLIYCKTPHLANDETASTATEICFFEQISTTYYIRTLIRLELNEKSILTSLKLTMNDEIHPVMLMATVKLARQVLLEDRFCGPLTRGGQKQGRSVLM